jgi:hypothetical protein
LGRWLNLLRRRTAATLRFQTRACPLFEIVKQERLVTTPQDARHSLAWAAQASVRSLRKLGCVCPRTSITTDSGSIRSCVLRLSSSLCMACMARAVYFVSFPCGSITMIAVFEQSGVSRSRAHSCRRKAQKFPRDELQQNRAAFVDRLRARLFRHVEEMLLLRRLRDSAREGFSSVGWY